VARLSETESADIVLLQEVARTPALQADVWLAHRLGMACAYSRANGHEAAIGFEEGLAILSRFPLAGPRLRQLGLGTNPFVRRLALAIDVATPFGELLAVSVHLALRHGHNAIQLAQLRDWVAGAAAGRPALIGGDYNAPEHRAEIQATQRAWLDTFRHLHPEADGTTHEVFWPWGHRLRRHRLDYIFFQAGPEGAHWEVLETRHLDAPGGPHSDHRAVLTRLAPAR
jgi:endonuclease/exonuclease/phosphatase family metal-dependent hydrolase